MKKFFTLLMLAVVFTFNVNAQDEFSGEAAKDDQTVVEESDSTAVEEKKEEMKEEVEEATVAEETTGDEEEARGFHQIVKQYFIDGGADFMGIVLVCLILGLAIAIERIITLNLASTNTKKLVNDVESALSSGGIEAAKEVARNSRGPVASIFAQGLMRSSEGIDMVEKSVVAYGSVEMGKLERGMVWISLFISLAPMFGFMGTVIGMIDAFNEIQKAGDVSPSLVAGGIKVALLTTVAGLIVAVILQVFYNYLVSKVDSIVNKMEDASISLIDVLVKHKVGK